MKTAAALASMAILAATASSAAAQAIDFAEINRRVPPPTAAEVRTALDAAQPDCASVAPTLGPVEPVTAWVRVVETVSSGDIANAWSVTAARPGCATAIEGRFILVRGAGGGLAAQFLHPGRSHADVYEMTDGVMNKAYRAAASAADRDVPGCAPELIGRSGGFLGSEIVDDSKLGPSLWGQYASGTWRESWAFAICGRTLTVFVDFTGTPEGVVAEAAPWASLKR